MKIYVAARFHDKENVKKIYRQLQDSGHNITVDWTVHAPCKPYDQNKGIARAYAIEDINGVMESDVFIFVTSEEAGTGTSTELGVAIATKISTGKPHIYLVGKHIDKNFCFYHPSIVLKDTIEQVIEDLKSK